MCSINLVTVRYLANGVFQIVNLVSNKSSSVNIFYFIL